MAQIAGIISNPKMEPILKDLDEFKTKLKVWTTNAVNAEKALLLKENKSTSAVYGLPEVSDKVMDLEILKAMELANIAWNILDVEENAPFAK